MDKVAIQEGDLLRSFLAAAVDAADLLGASRHPEEQPLDVCAGLSEAAKDETLIGQGVQVGLQGTDLARLRPVVGDINGVEFALGDPAEPLGPSLSGLGASRPVTVALARVDALQLIPPGSKRRGLLPVLGLRGEVGLEVRAVALDPVVNGFLAPVCRKELTKLPGDLLLTGDTHLRA